MTTENTPYKDQGISWGAITCGLQRDSKGWWWIAKNYNGLGIFRFRDSDVYPSETEAKKHPLPAAVVLLGETMSTFAFDEKAGKLFVYSSGSKQGFYEFDLPDYTVGTKLENATFSKAMDCNPENTTTGEGLFVTQIAVDPETGKAYFCYRPQAGDTSEIGAGIVVYDPATKSIKNYGETKDLATGCVINTHKTKLF